MSDILDHSGLVLLDSAGLQISDDGGALPAINVTFAINDQYPSNPDSFFAAVTDGSPRNVTWAVVEDTQDVTQIFIGSIVPIVVPTVGLPLNDTDYKAWLADPSSAKCVLIEVQAYINGEERTFYLSNLGFVTSEADTPSTTHYDSVVMGGCEISEEISIEGGVGQMTVGDVEISNVNGQLDEWFTYIWTSRPIRVYYGDVRWARGTFRLVFSGIIEDIAAAGRNKINIVIRDKLQRLNTSLTELKVGGEGQNADKLIPITLGEVSNVTPLLIDEVDLVYQVHQGWLERIIEVRDDGVPVNVTVLPDGKFSLLASPAGTITCSVQGAKPDGTYISSVSKIVQYITTNFGTDKFTQADLDITSLSAFDIANPHKVGIYCDNRANILDICNGLAESIGARVVMTPLNLLRLVKIQLPTQGGFTEVNESNFKAKSFELVQRIKPAPSVKIGYCKNWTVQKNLQTGIPESHKDLFEEEWLTYTATDSVYRGLYKLSAEPPEQIDTYLISTAMAQSEANRRKDLWKSQRAIYSYEGFPELLLEELGGGQHIVHKRFNMQQGVQAQIVGITRNWLLGTVHFKVLA